MKQKRVDLYAVALAAFFLFLMVSESVIELIIGGLT